jgi:CheY-like chemotaxis protein
MKKRDRLTFDPVTGAARMVRVLVVDDQPAVGEVVLGALELEGYEVRLCTTGEDARAMLADWTPEVLVTDLLMLPEDGSSLIAWVRKRFGKRIRIVLYSARHNAQVTEAVAEASHPDAFVSKPFELDDLYKAVAGV